MRTTIQQIRCDRCGGGVEPGNKARKTWWREAKIPEGWLIVEMYASGNPNWSTSGMELCRECSKGLTAYLKREDPEQHPEAVHRERHGPFVFEVTQLGDGFCYRWLADDRIGKHATVFKSSDRRFDTVEQATRQGRHWFQGLLLRVLSHSHDRLAVD